MKSKVNYNENQKPKLIENQDKGKKEEKMKKNKYKNRNEVSALFFLSENLIVLKKKELIKYMISNQQKDDSSNELSINIEENYMESSNRKISKLKDTKKINSYKKTKKNTEENDYVETINIDDENSQNYNTLNNSHPVNLNNFSLHQVSSKYKNLKNINENTFLAKKREKHLRERYTEYMDSQTNKRKKVGKNLKNNNNFTVNEFNIGINNNENSESKLTKIMI
jgi:hypothetical protein